MGYSLSWLALHTEDADEALRQLGYRRSGESCAYAKAPESGHALPGHWYLVVARGCDHRFLRPPMLERLSRLFPLVACSVEEHVMFSSTEYWADGQRVWRAEHGGEDGPIHLDTTGDLPPGFEAMAAGCRAAQEADGGAGAGVDHYFDIPLNAARELTGFKHDEDIAGIDYDGFDLLRPLAPSNGARPWWRFW